MSNHHIEIFTDGGISDNTKRENVGTWAFTLKYKDKYYEESGIILNTTNNVCELTAILKALRKLKKSDIPIILYSDSQYCVNSINIWAKSWMRNNWINSEKKPVKNKELIQEIYYLVKSFKDIKINWVRGHDKNLGNIRVDELCTLERNKYLKQFYE